MNNKRFNQIISESVKKVLREAFEAEASLPQAQMKGQQIIEKINTLVSQANQAYAKNKAEWGDDACLMDKEGTVYGLSSDIKLHMNGYLIIPFSAHQWSSYETEKIKVFTKIGGRYKLYKDEYHADYDWRDASKMLKQIIADAERYRKDMEGYDVSWEDPDTLNPKAIRDFNKSIGVRADYRKPW